MLFSGRDGDVAKVNGSFCSLRSNDGCGMMIIIACFLVSTPFKRVCDKVA